MSTPSIDEQIRDVEREIKMRERAYPRWVDSGRLKQTDADYRLACMRAVLDTLRAHRDATPGPPVDLFDG